MEAAENAKFLGAIEKPSHSIYIEVSKLFKKKKILTVIFRILQK